MINPNAGIICDEKRIGPEKSEVNRLLGCNRKIREPTDWEPLNSIDHVLEVTVKWIRDHLDLYKADYLLCLRPAGLYNKINQH